MCTYFKIEGVFVNSFKKLSHYFSEINFYRQLRCQDEKITSLTGGISLSVKSNGGNSLHPWLKNHNLSILEIKTSMTMVELDRSATLQFVQNSF
jgi:hypothetical protein